MGHCQMSKTYQEIQEFLFHLNKVINDTKPTTMRFDIVITMLFFLSPCISPNKKHINRSNLQMISLPYTTRRCATVTIEVPSTQVNQKAYSSWLHDHQSPTQMGILTCESSHGVRIFKRRMSHNNSTTAGQIKQNLNLNVWGIFGVGFLLLNPLRVGCYDLPKKLNRTKNLWKPLSKTRRSMKQTYPSCSLSRESKDDLPWLSALVVHWRCLS